VSEIDPKLSRLYRGAASEGPPAAVDAAILAAARRQTPKPQRRERPSWLRWMAPASAMATLALGVSLALLVERERPEILDGAAMRESVPRPQRPPPAAPAESAQPKAADSAAHGVAAKREAPATAAPAPALADTAPAPMPRMAEPAAPAAEAFTAERRAKAAVSGAAGASNTASDAAVRGPEAAAPAAADRLAPTRQQTLQRSPEAWLDEISRLRREGREKEASEQLAEFRKAHPAYALPESLRDLR
jgi:hypothetical protein